VTPTVNKENRVFRGSQYINFRRFISHLKNAFRARATSKRTWWTWRLLRLVRTLFRLSHL